MTDKDIIVNGLSGLANIGNTCYMNAALQCLSATNVFSTFIRSRKFTDDLNNNAINLQNKNCQKNEEKLSESDDLDVDISEIIKHIKHSVIYNYYKLVKKMWKDNFTIEPKSFKNSIGSKNKIFAGSEQNDSQEFLNFLLDQIHEELKGPIKIQYSNVPNTIIDFRNKKNYLHEKLMSTKIGNKFDHEIFTKYKNLVNNNLYEYTVNASMEYWDNYIMNSHSIIRDIFSGMTYTSTKCSQCDMTTLAFEPHIMLSVSIPENAKNLYDCLKYMSQTVELQGENAFDCSTCGEKTDAKQNTYVWEAPNILIIHIKRFSQTAYGTRIIRTEKNNTKIDFPFNDLTLDDVYSPFNKKNDTYSLYGVVHQYGSLNGGHYNASCFNIVSQKWYSFDDSSVHYMPDDVLKQKLCDSSPYILFYKKNC
jgi:ubiquitin C-terminal hydrolase